MSYLVPYKTPTFSAGSQAVGWTPYAPRAAKWSSPAIKIQGNRAAGRRCSRHAAGWLDRVYFGLEFPDWLEENMGEWVGPLEPPT